MGVRAYGKEITMADINNTQETTIEETAETVATPETSGITEEEVKEIVGDPIPELQETKELTAPTVEYKYISFVKIPLEEYKEFCKKEALLELLIKAKKEGSSAYTADHILDVIAGKDGK